MKTMFFFLLFIFIGLIFIPGCSKETKVYVPVSFTDKEGNVIIQIDTISKSFDAYSTTKISQGRLTGIFNDTIRSSFYLAITTDPFWDTVYHARDTIIFPMQFKGHTLAIETNIDLKDFNSPYHFLLVGLCGTHLKCGPHGNPSIKIIVDTQDE